MPKVTLLPKGWDTPLTLDVEWGAGAGGLTGFTLAREQVALRGEGSVGADGEGILRIGARVLPFYASRTGDELHLWLDGEIYVFTLAADTRAGRPRAQALPASGEVVSPMPGMVLRVLARPGDEVAAQSPLVVIESMKMELTIPAPADGKVAEVLCEPGQRVDRGALLLRLEPPKGAPPA